ncbi:MAG: hypothetical protein JW913_14745, partial [Chitinispirillaceae bacterium]|nr:hypothetical protein [Chitinispirillaceae bacterium]
MRIRALLLRIGVLLAFAPVFCLGQGLRVEPPWITGFHPLDEAPYEPSPLNARKAVILKLETKMFHDTAQIDFEKRQITFRRVEALGYTMWEYHFGELSDYLASRRNYAFNQSWRKGMTALQPGESAAGRQGLKLEWELPVQYPTWAQRVLGKEPPKLTIDGFLEISFGFENTQYEQKIGAEQNRPTNAPVFDLNYSFTITGSVGRLISVNIRADKEQNFDISDNLKNFKVEYKEATPGELEDEIIQEVIVGYTGFSMPGTNLSGYSESHEGLFGIKIRSRLGPLELTAIASTEQGQSNKKTYSSSGGSGDVPTIEARKFQNDRYFFLDNTYRRYYIQKYAPEGLNPTAPPKVKNLSVWRSFDGWNTDKKSHIRKVKVDAIDQTYPYERLERDKHYYLDDAEGWIRFDDTISFRDDQQVAIFMRTEDTTQFPHLQKGGMKDTTLTDSITGATVLDTIWTLWTLRPMPSQINSAEDDTSRFYLMWRHAYGPGDFSDPASFTLAVKRIGKDGKGSIEQVGTTYFSEILGIADNNNKPYIANTQIFNKQFNDLIFPPFDTSWNGLDVFDNPALDAVPGDEKHRDPTIYRYSKSRMEDKISEGYQDIFEIAMSGSRKKTTFDDLGWGIMKETEIVKGDGVTLKRDEDYTINYDMGIVDLISAKAKACAKIDIEFQSEALFVPERKMFLGSHGKVDLPFLSGKSYAGASVLFQSTQTNEDIPRLDQEPYNKLLLDVNTHIEFEPQWMTGLVNALPLVKTQAPSSVTLDLEFAHSRVNPNKNGSAYIDDFEDSKQS